MESVPPWAASPTRSPSARADGSSPTERSWNALTESLTALLTASGSDRETGQRCFRRTRSNSLKSSRPSRGKSPPALINSRASLEEVKFICEDAGAKVLFVHPSLEDIARAAAPESVQQTLVIGDTYEDWLSSSSSLRPALKAEEWDTFCIPYTAGTTGLPKGVLLPHRSRVLTFFSMAVEYGCYGPDDHAACLSRPFTTVRFAFAVAPVFFGGTCDIVPRFDPEELLRAIDTCRATNVFMVPSHFQALFELGDEVLNRYDTSSLRTIISNAAPLAQVTKKNGSSSGSATICCSKLMDRPKAGLSPTSALPTSPKAPVRRSSLPADLGANRRPRRKGTRPRRAGRTLQLLPIPFLRKIPGTNPKKPVKLSRTAGSQPATSPTAMKRDTSISSTARTTRSSQAVSTSSLGRSKKSCSDTPQSSKLPSSASPTNAGAKQFTRWWFFNPTQRQPKTRSSTSALNRRSHATNCRNGSNSLTPSRAMQQGKILRRELRDPLLGRANAQGLLSLGVNTQAAASGSPASWSLDHLPQVKVQDVNDRLERLITEHDLRAA